MTDVAPRSQIRNVALCAGGGGLELGLGRALSGALRTVLYVEREAYAAAVLAARMADGGLAEAAVWSDIVTLDCARWRGLVDCVTAGFPCTPWSSAGKGRGAEDERWIWPDIARIIRELRPGIVFLENVPPLVVRGGLALVLADLASLGFDAEWGVLGADAVGAPHQRDRLFILAWSVPDAIRDALRLATERDQRERRRERASERGNAELGDMGGKVLANSDSDGLPIVRSGCLLDGEREARRHDADGRGWDVANTDDSPSWRSSTYRRQSDDAGRGHSMGYAAGDGWNEVGGRGEGDPGNAWSGDTVACVGDAECERPQGLVEAGPAAPSVVRANRDDFGIFPPGPSDSHIWGRIIRERPDLAPATQSGVRRVAHGMAKWLGNTRAHELRLLGNGVVQAQAAAAFHALAARALGASV